MKLGSFRHVYEVAFSSWFPAISASLSFLVEDFWEYTDKKEKKIFLIYKESQMGSGAKSYMRKGFLIWCILKNANYLTIYVDCWDRKSSMTLDAIPKNFLYIWENFIFFFTSVVFATKQELRNVFRFLAGFLKMHDHIIHNVGAKRAEIISRADTNEISTQKTWESWESRLVPEQKPSARGTGVKRISKKLNL